MTDHITDFGDRSWPRVLTQRICCAWRLERSEFICSPPTTRTNTEVPKANILIDNTLSIRLADFGLALFADASTASLGSHIGGSARWMCPRLLSGALSRPNYTCDVYALGCVAVEVRVFYV